MAIVPSSHDPMSGLDAAWRQRQHALHDARDQVTWHRTYRATIGGSAGRRASIARAPNAEG